MIKSYDELLEAVLKLLSQPEKCNGFFKTDFNQFNVCREEKHGYTFATILESPREGKAIVVHKHLDYARYDDDSLWVFGSIYYANRKAFERMPMVEKMQCVFETTPIVLMHTITRTYDNAYKEFLKLINTPYERKDAE